MHLFLCSPLPLCSLFLQAAGLGSSVWALSGWVFLIFCSLRFLSSLHVSEDLQNYLSLFFCLPLFSKSACFNVKSESSASQAAEDLPVFVVITGTHAHNGMLIELHRVSWSSRSLLVCTCLRVCFMYSINRISIFCYPLL